MTALASLRSLVFEDDPSQFQAEPPPVPAPPPVQGQPDSSRLAELSKEVFARSSAYTALLNTYAALADAVPDEGARFGASVKAVAANNITPAMIAQAITAHLQSLDEERANFLGHTLGEMDSQIADAKAEQARLDGLIQANTESIRQLEEQNRQYTQGRTTASERVTSLTTKRETDKQQFELAAQHLAAQLRADQSRLTKTK